MKEAEEDLQKSLEAYQQANGTRRKLGNMSRRSCYSRKTQGNKEFKYIVPQFCS